MLTHDEVARHPSVFPDLFGVTFPEFEPLFAAYEAARQRLLARSKRTWAGTPRVRKPGGGDKPDLAPRTRLLMALFWLRVYPTYELLGFFFGLHKRNAQLGVRAVLAVLQTLDDFPFDRPGPGRRKMRSAAQAMDAFPGVRLVIDGKEQRVRRPRAQRLYYSGKKKAHTLKTQVAVDPSGRIESVSRSVPGRVHDLRLLRRTGLIGRLAAGEGAMLDKGYDGIANDHPDKALILPHKARRHRPLTRAQKRFNRVVGRYRIVVEHTMAQLNRFAALRQVYRGRPTGHSAAVRSAAVLVNRRTEVKPLKTYPALAA
jgi:hypothetical protein